MFWKFLRKIKNTYVVKFNSIYIFSSKWTMCNKKSLKTHKSWFVVLSRFFFMKIIIYILRIYDFSSLHITCTTYNPFPREAVKMEFSYFIACHRGDGSMPTVKRSKFSSRETCKHCRKIIHLTNFNFGCSYGSECRNCKNRESGEMKLYEECDAFTERCVLMSRDEDISFLITRKFLTFPFLIEVFSLFVFLWELNAHFPRRIVRAWK